MSHAEFIEQAERVRSIIMAPKARTPSGRREALEEISIVLEHMQGPERDELVRLTAGLMQLSQADEELLRGPSPGLL